MRLLRKDRSQGRKDDVGFRNAQSTYEGMSGGFGGSILAWVKSVVQSISEQIPAHAEQDQHQGSG